MRRALIVFAITFLMVLLVYRRVPMNFFRAESGWYLSNSHADADTQRTFKANFFKTSYAGHYTPFGFLAEFATAKAFGTNATLWRVRQLIALALIGALLFLICRAVGSVFGLPSLQNVAVACAVTAVSIYQPLMIDFIAWPFMILQLTWIALLLLALFALTKLAAGERKARWTWAATMSAYASMHISGLGAVTVTAVAVVLGAMLLVAPRSSANGDRREIGRPLIAMLCLAAIHGALMIGLLPTEPSLPGPADARPFGESAKLALGFLANFVLAGAGSFLATAVAQPNPRSIAYCWPYGVLLLIAAGGVVVWLFRRWRDEPSPRTLLSFTLAAFSAVSFVMLIGLFAARQFRSGTLSALASQFAFCLSVPRYVIPLHFVFASVAILAAARLARLAPRLSAGLCAAIVIAALAAQVEFQRSAHKYVAPLSHVSHSSAWRLILATVQECRAAGLPMPHVPLATLTQEFHDIDPHLFEPLIRRDLRLPPDYKIALIPWEDYLAAPERYVSVPSLQLLEQKLRLRRD